MSLAVADAGWRQPKRKSEFAGREEGLSVGKAAGLQLDHRGGVVDCRQVKVETAAIVTGQQHVASCMVCCCIRDPAFWSLQQMVWLLAAARKEADITKQTVTQNETSNQ